MSLYHSAQNILCRLEQMRYVPYINHKYHRNKDNELIDDMYDQVQKLVTNLKEKHDKRMNEKILFNELNVHEHLLPKS